MGKKPTDIPVTVAMLILAVLIIFSTTWTLFYIKEQANRIINELKQPCTTESVK